MLGLPGSRRRAIRCAAAMLLFYLLALTPWTARNWAQFGRIVPIQANAGYTLVVSSFEARSPEVRNALRAVGERRHDTENRDAGWFRHGLRLIVENPGNFVSQCLRRLVRMWYFTDTQRFPPPAGTGQRHSADGGPASASRGCATVGGTCCPYSLQPPTS